MRRKALNLLFAGVLAVALGIGAHAAGDGETVMEGLAEEITADEASTASGSGNTSAGDSLNTDKNTANDAGQDTAKSTGKSYITAVTPTGNTASAGNAATSGESDSESDAADDENTDNSDNIDDTDTNLTDASTDTDDDAAYDIEDVVDINEDGENSDGSFISNDSENNIGEIERSEADSDATDDSDSDGDSEGGYNYALADPYGIATASHNNRTDDFTVYFCNCQMIKTANFWAEMTNIYCYGYFSSTSVGTGDSGIVQMQVADGVLYKYTFSTYYDTVIFLNQSSWPTFGSYYGGQTNDLSIDWDRYSAGTYPMFMLIGGRQDDYDANKEWSGTGANGDTTSVLTYTPPVNTDSDESNYEYFNVDFIDYLNDSRAVGGSSDTADNQGSYMHAGQNPFTYLNYVISNLANTNSYTYPLYFGSLLFVDNRWGSSSGDSLIGSASNISDLYSWNTTYNVALGNSDGGNDTTYTAAVQGLVGNKLGANGQLTDPKDNTTELPYFDATALGNAAVAYTGHLFPFIKTKVSDDVTEYSYDSLTNYAVYLDSSTEKLVRSYSYVYDNDANRGFFPLNQANANLNAINYGFGAKFTIHFTVNENGTIDGTDDGEHITFNFTGDDDVWVFIDNYLVLDMGGAHSKATGKIDFKDLKATVDVAVPEASSVGGLGGSITAGGHSYYNDATWNNSWLYSKVQVEKYDDYGNSTGTGDQGYYGFSYTLIPTSSSITVSGETEQQRSTVGYSTNVEKRFEDIETTTEDGATSNLAASFDYSQPDASEQVHTLTMFYMERGMFDSNLKLTFDITLQDKDVDIEKDVLTDSVNEGLAEAVEENGTRSDPDGTVTGSGNDDAFDYYLQTKREILVTPVTEGQYKDQYYSSETDQYYDPNECEIYQDQATQNWYVIIYTPVDITDTYTYVNDNGNESDGQTMLDSKAKGLTDDTSAHLFLAKDETDAFTKGETINISESDNNSDNIFSYSTAWKLVQNDYDDSLEDTNTYTETSYGAGKEVEFYFGKEVEGDNGETKIYAPLTYYVDYTNDLLVGSFSVTKAWNAADSSFLTSNTDEFTFKVEIDLDGSDTDTHYAYTVYPDLTYTTDGKTYTELGSDGTFTLKVGETVTFAGIPVGAHVKITEVTTGGTTLATGYNWRAQNNEYSQVITITDADNGLTLDEDDGTYKDEYTGALSELDPIEVTFTNEVDRGTLTISKKVVDEEGNEPDSGSSDYDDLTSAEFYFTVYLYTSYDPNDSGNNVKATLADGTYYYDDNDTQSITFSSGVSTTAITLKHGESITIKGLPAGITYVVVEAENSEYVTYVGQVDDENQTDTATGTIVSDAGNDTQASVLYYNKHNALGSITIIKVDAEGNTLDGVVFSITDGDGNKVTNNAGVEYTTLTTGDKKNGNDFDEGTVVFEKLKKGTYIITEVQTQQGYTLLKDPITITIPMELSDEYVEEHNVDTSGEGVQHSGSTYYFYNVTYEVVNTATLSMPVAGNTTRNFVVVVCVVFLTGGLGYFALCGKGLLAVKAVTTIPAALDLRATRAGAYGAKILKEQARQRFHRRE